MEEIKEEIKHGESEEVKTSKEGEETANNNLEAIMDETDLDETKELKDESVSLEEKLAEKTAEYEDIFDQFQRLQADFANYKKRVEREKNEIFLYANEKIGLDLLNIIDNLERAIQSQSESDNIEESSCLLDGINLVYRQLVDVLSKHGIKEIEALGKPFDMNLHHAVAQEETEGEPNYVIDVFQKGYKINEKVLRPAMVKVSK